VKSGGLIPCVCEEKAIVCHYPHEEQKMWRVCCSSQGCWSGPWHTDKLIAVVRWNAVMDPHNGRDFQEEENGK
jgi:hypothetical protein